MGYLIAAALAVCVYKFLLPVLSKRLETWYVGLKRETAYFQHARVFSNDYIEAKAFYLKEFGETPCINYITNVDTVQAVEYIQSGAVGKVLAVYHSNYYNWQEGKEQRAITVFKLENKVLIDVSHLCVDVLHNNDPVYAARLVEALVPFKVPEKEAEYEINIITSTNRGLDLKPLAIKPTLLDVDLYYNDDFKEVDTLIRERLSTQNDKGIVLLHGLPGTGKTTYLRYLIGSLRKKVLFLSPAVAANLMDPEFMDLLIDHPNSVLIIEDAENVIMDRRNSSHSSVSNLLNISDGLLSDCLNVQIICTFNNALHLIDSALMRKGRLIAKYEFGKLTVEKARRLSNHLGLQQPINEPMTLADITNGNGKDYTPVKANVIGFRRTAELQEN
ncbi:MAG: AAA family ATPase [Williamsia sp.]|nr:AAA family ATPase [Williamsia sp.]